MNSRLFLLLSDSASILQSYPSSPIHPLLFIHPYPSNPIHPIHPILSIQSYPSNPIHPILSIQSYPSNPTKKTIDCCFIFIQFLYSFSIYYLHTSAPFGSYAAFLPAKICIKMVIVNSMYSIPVTIWVGSKDRIPALIRSEEIESFRF